MTKLSKVLSSTIHFELVDGRGGPSWFFNDHKIHCIGLCSTLPCYLLTNYHLNQLFSTGANSVDLIGRPCLLCETQQLLVCIMSLIISL